MILKKKLYLVELAPTGDWEQKTVEFLVWGYTQAGAIAHVVKDTARAAIASHEEIIRLTKAGVEPGDATSANA